MRSIGEVGQWVDPITGAIYAAVVIGFDWAPDGRTSMLVLAVWANRMSPVPSQIEQVPAP